MILNLELALTLLMYESFHYYFEKSQDIKKAITDLNNLEIGWQEMCNYIDNLQRNLKVNVYINFSDKEFNKILLEKTFISKSENGNFKFNVNEESIKDLEIKEDFLNLLLDKMKPDLTVTSKVLIKKRKK